MGIQNCWEYKKCGREPGGANANQLGVCPAAITKCLNKMNSGKNGGRSCWAVAGTLCGGQVQGTFASKVGNCMKCDFYQLVRQEEGVSYVTPQEIIKILEKG